MTMEEEEDPQKTEQQTGTLAVPQQMQLLVRVASHEVLWTQKLRSPLLRTQS